MNNLKTLGQPVLFGLLLLCASLVEARATENNELRIRSPRYFQVVEPKPVPGIPDVVLGAPQHDVGEPGKNPLDQVTLAVNEEQNRPQNSADMESVLNVPTSLEAQTKQHRVNQLAQGDARMAARSSKHEADNVAEPAIPDRLPLNDKPDATKSRWYAGASVGRSGLDAGYQRTFQTIFSTGATSVTVVPSVKDTMWKAYAGYQISSAWSVEAGYWNFGDTSYSAMISAPVTTTMNRHFTIRGLGGGAVYKRSLTDSISGFAKLGAVMVSAKASAATPGGGLSALPAQSSNTVNPLWGVGAEYSLNQELALRLEYEVINKAGDNAKFGTADIVLWGLGVDYKF